VSSPRYSVHAGLVERLARVGSAPYPLQLP